MYQVAITCAEFISFTLTRSSYTIKSTALASAIWKLSGQIALAKAADYGHSNVMALLSYFYSKIALKAPHRGEKEKQTTFYITDR